MAKTSTETRYHVGYNKPVEGAVGNSPQEYHFVGGFDDPFAAIAEIAKLTGHKAFILDAKYNALATIVTGPGSLSTRLITYLNGVKVDEQPSVIGSDGKSYPLDAENIPG